MEIDIEQTPNFSPGRMGHTPIGFVIHSAEGHGVSLFNWLKNPNSRVSYHYLIKFNGQIVQFVRPEDTAWHAGKVVRPVWPRIKQGVNPNLYTIGLAFEGYADPGPTMRQICFFACLCTFLSSRFNIPIDLRTVIPHNWIRADKNCPGRNTSMLAIIYLSGLRP